ncbi:MAG TPA: hypothetical protein VIL26_03455 [Clostridia bacterium]
MKPIKAKLAWENAVPLGEDTSDIYGFKLVLSIGDISEKSAWNKIRQLISCTLITGGHLNIFYIKFFYYN